MKGEMPIYTGDTPIREEDEQYTYEFLGWYPKIEIVTGDATYTAVYDRFIKPQGIEDIYGNHPITPNKIFIDGQILILREGRVYTLTGQEIR